MASKRPVDFQILRRRIKPADVLRLHGTPTRREPSGEWRGPCPIHGSKSTRSRSFACSAEVAFCHSCKWRGDGVALWAALKSLDMLDAAYDLADRLLVIVPYLQS